MSLLFSEPGARGMCPRVGTRPYDGRSVNTPQQWAGSRVEPDSSPPSSSPVNPAAIAAAAPPDEPPGDRSRFHGLLVVPNTGL
jgi:hypothetical protein